MGTGGWGLGNGESGMGDGDWRLGNGDYGPSFTSFSFHEQTGSFLYWFFWGEVFFNLFKSTASGVCRRGDAFQGWSYFTRHSVTDS